MRLRALIVSRDREPASVSPTLELPASALELAGSASDEAPPAAERTPDWAHDPDVRQAARAGRTARAQYRESEEYEPLWAILLGLPGRMLLIVAILIVYNAALGWIAVQVWHSAGSSNDHLLVIAVIGIGAVAGWAAADMEQAFRSRSRFYG